MQWINLSYSTWCNRRHGRSGHLFQGRFGGVVVDFEQWGVELSRYEDLNPVRSAWLGLGKRERMKQRQGMDKGTTQEVVRQRVAALREYRWSSYRAYAEEALKRAGICPWIE
jgi:hypothetical protein